MKLEDKIQVLAKIEELDKVNQYIEQQLQKIDCPARLILSVQLAVEEAFVNIAKYAYPEGGGDVRILTEVSLDPQHITIVLKDRGVPYNPLEKEDPDVTLSAKERKIGGLGVYLVKKNMDNVDYTYEDGFNILSMKKNID